MPRRGDRGLVAMLLGAADAQAVPSVTFKCTPAPQNCSGWYPLERVGRVDGVPAEHRGDRLPEQDVHHRHTRTERVLRRRRRRGDGDGRAQDQGRQDAAGRHRRHSPPAPRTSTAGTTTPSRSTFARQRPDLGHRRLHLDHLRRPGQRCGHRRGDVHRQRRQRQRPLRYGLKYDETAPAVDGARPERPAERATAGSTGPCASTSTGTDATSGIADCPPVTYGGPDSATASFTGTCRDRPATPPAARSRSSTTRPRRPSRAARRRAART